MPPKKKKGGKRKGGKKKKKDDTELTVEDKYKQTLHDITSLKEKLSLQNELARRSLSSSAQFKNKMKFTTDQLEEHQEDSLAISSEMTRQYKTMQTEMGIRLHQYELDVERLKDKLTRTESLLDDTLHEKQRITKEKDDKIQELQIKIDSMEIAYENILHETLDSLVNRMEIAKQKWEDQATAIQDHHKHLLLDFGLNPLDI